MDYVFFGTPAPAAIALEELIKSGYIPAAVVTNPDAPAGRKRIMTAPAVKQLISKLSPATPVFQPEKITADFLDKLKKVKADIYVIASYNKILPQTLLDIPKYGAINIHPSLLPKYRGPSPVPSAILNGETETGVTIFKLDAQMDHGPMFHSCKAKIDPEDNTPSLLEKLFRLGADMLSRDIFPNIDSLSLIPQDESETTYTKKFATSDGYIEYRDIQKAQTDSKELASVIDRKIRALYPEPGCWTMKSNMRIKILDSKLEKGLLKIKIIQKEGRNPTSAEII
ncbi:MAG: methionyl-tRNA formyltransferase [Candidatus Colwellbacteria bacterium]|nr:methionyl-tRNA formyltransferase [Candidatus Colwellbacteria bacterium]